MKLNLVRFGDIDRISTVHNDHGCEATIRVTHEDLARFPNLPLQQMRPGVKQLTVVYDNIGDRLGYRQAHSPQLSQSPKSLAEFRQLLDLVKALPIYGRESEQVKNTLTQKVRSHFNVFCQDRLRYLTRMKEHHTQELEKVTTELETYTTALAQWRTEAEQPPPDIDYYI